MKTTNTAVRDQKSEVIQHTPGPWTNRQSDHERAVGHIWVTQEGQGHVPLIARVAEGIPQAEANARLIAAAPELLAALEKICSREMTAWNGQVKGILFEDICAAKTAISKATGQTAATAGQTCPHCGLTGQAPDSLKCDDCGKDLPEAYRAATRGK